jgi:hypothetical protein
VGRFTEIPKCPCGLWHYLWTCASAWGPLFACQYVIMVENACVATSAPEQCATVYSGLMTKGLVATLGTYNSMYIELLETRNVSEGDLGVVQVWILVFYA